MAREQPRQRDLDASEYMVRGADVYRLVTDHLGSVRLVVNTATGSVVQRIDYDEWGVVASDTSPGFQPFGFAGGLYDADTKLVRFGARDYDAEVGRWTAKDPVLWRGGQKNLYVYVDDDPINRRDPRGLDSGAGGAGGASGYGGSGGHEGGSSIDTQPEPTSSSTSDDGLLMSTVAIAVSDGPEIGPMDVAASVWLACGVMENIRDAARKKKPGCYCYCITTGVGRDVEGRVNTPGDCKDICDRKIPPKGFKCE
jgi:RHS repeat-associated protein